jgi:hypothetical protein
VRRRSQEGLRGFEEDAQGSAEAGDAAGVAASRGAAPVTNDFDQARLIELLNRTRANQRRIYLAMGVATACTTAILLPHLGHRR